MKTLRSLGYLLEYPTPQWQQDLPDVKAALLAEAWLPPAALKAVTSFIDTCAQADILEMQERYVELFDRTPSLCLHLFEHIHGESRERGQALVDLSQVYQDAGLLIDVEEMPDYLPLFLEYTSVIEVEQARHDLAGIVNILAILSERLRNRESAYADVLDGIISAAKTQPDAEVVASAIKVASGKPLTQEQMDAAWREQHAFENDSLMQGQSTQDGCPQAEEMLARMGLTSQEHKD